MAFTLEAGDPGRPTGTVTFLFTDIEGSTRRWERDRNAMSAALARHDALLRPAISARGGFLFKTVGDAFCAAFAIAADAVAAARDAQAALLAEDFSGVDSVLVRMALHTGSAEERDGDYFGPAVNRVARLLAIGHGGQVLVSGTTADLLQEELPSESSLRDLGEHQLKDLARREHVYQLVAPGLLDTFPALRSLEQLPHNLPPQLTSFVGREHDVVEIKRLLDHSRLLTLVGTGGAGKTRCAIQAGAELLDGFGDGVWLVELAPISDASLVGAEIARALGVRERPNRPLLDTLLEYMQRRNTLLILDNCEHVIDEARGAVAAILRACPDVRTLATSRENLNIAGERVFSLPSLSVPPAGAAASAKAALAYGSVALFADRAVASDARFELTNENTSHVAEICGRLDGIPLAIELAAARVKVLSPKQLAQKLDERFRVLTGGDRSALPRHQTMRALIDWSYDLLCDEERAVFRKLSVFAGGFTLASASAVCGDDAVDEIAVLDVLASLVDKSLVHAESGTGATRYRLLESTREYAREKLVELGEYPAVARAHAEAFVASAEQLERTWESTPDREWLEQVEPEFENVRAALEWALTARGDVPLGQRLTGALRRAWANLAPREGQHWVRAALERAETTTQPAAIARLDLTEAVLDTSLAQYAASYAAAQHALARYGALDDPLRTAETQRYAGNALALLGRIPESEVILREALVVARGLGARKLTGGIVESLATARLGAGDLAGARAGFAEALEIYKASGAERPATAGIATNLAELEFRGGDPSRALEFAGEALTAARAARSVHAEAHLLCNMAAYLIALSRYDEARVHARESISLGRAQTEVAAIFSIQHLAAVATLRSRDDQRQARTDRTRAVRLLGYVDARVATLDARREHTEQREYDAILPLLCEAVGRHEFAILVSEGRAWTEDRAIAEAMLV